jgi:CheY-like chemotaxis protein
MLALAIRAAGFTVHLAVDGQDACDQLNAGLSVDVLLMDIRMPRMGGIELLRFLRSDPRFADLPVIAMSAYSDELQEQEVRAAGAAAFLPKPFTIADLRAVLDVISGPSAR